MKLISMLKAEFSRLLLSRLTRLLGALTLCSPALGLTLYRPLPSYAGTGYSTSDNGTFIANPALAGALAGAALFAVLTAFEFNRGWRGRMKAITHAVVSPFHAVLVRTTAIVLTAALVQGITLLTWLPFTASSIGTAFKPGLYVSIYLAVMLPAILFATLFTSAASIVTGRPDLTLMLFAAFMLLSLTVWQGDWLLRWINPSIPYLSDAFGTSRLLRSLHWNRLFWLLTLSGIWMASLLAVRRYSKGLLSSAITNVRKGYILLLAALFSVSAWISYADQPFLDHSKRELADTPLYKNVTFNDFVTFSSIRVKATPDFEAERHYGIAAYTLRNTSGEQQTIRFELNPGYTFHSATANGTPVSFRDLADDEENVKTMEVDIPADEEMELVLNYGGFPQDWNIMEIVQGQGAQISRDYLHLTNAEFAPIPSDIVWEGDKPNPYIIDLTLPPGMIPVLFGSEAARSTGADSAGFIRWNIETSGYSIILYAGDYLSRHIKAADLDVELWYSARHRSVIGNAQADRMIQQVFQYCTDRFGPLDFFENNRMKLIEIGISGGGYASNGVSVMGESSFSERGLEDVRKGAGADEVLAHEIIHQWWGLGNMFDSQDSGGVWSSEGLTVYTTYRLMKEIYGEHYAQRNYVDKWQAEVDAHYLNFYNRHPEYLEKLPTVYRNSINNSYAQMKQYAEMPLKLLKAERLVGGEENMDALLKTLFNREIDYTAPFLSYQQFLDTCGLTKEELELE